MEGAPVVSTVEPLRLLPRQVEAFHKGEAILDKFYFYMAGSEPGAGKTFEAGAHALQRKLPVIVVCPLSASPVWEKFITQYGLSLYNLPETGGIVTYESLRSTKGHQPKHGLLVREDSETAGVSFYATTMFSAIISSGVLLIFDECQKVKNNSDQHKAVKALLKQFYFQDIRKSRSRFALLSGTIVDKQEHVVNFMKLVGFVEAPKLYSKYGGEVRLEGIQEVHNWATLIDREATSRFIAQHPFQATRAGSVEHVYKLFLEVIKPAIMTTMPSMQLSKDIKNGFYVLEPGDELKYKQACSSLARAVGYNPNQGTVMMTKENLGAVTKSLVLLQKAKVKAMIRVAKDLLNTPVPGSNGQMVYRKVLLYADYYEVMDELHEAFRDYGTVELSGRIKKPEDRALNVDLFQTQNHNTRVLIGNPIVGGVAVSLHDTTGYFPRVLLMMPNYLVSAEYQATGRIAREGLVGTAVSRLFYGLSGARENSLLNAIARKGEILSEVHKEQGAKFPNEYENEYEAQVPVESPGFELFQPEEGEVEEMIRRASEQQRGQLEIK